MGFIPDCICRLRFRLHLQTTCSDHIPGFISDCIPTTFPTTISGYISDSKTHRKICTYSGATPKTLAHTPLSHIGLRLQALAVLPARELPEPLSQDGQRDLRVQASFSEFFFYVVRLAFWPNLASARIINNRRCFFPEPRE